jgi:elongation factor Ts
MIECKKALEEASGDTQKAQEILVKRGAEIASKKSERQTKTGLVDSYVHPNGKMGVLLELDCETDFVARNENFKNLAHELSLHVAAMNPQNLEELLAQPFIKNPEITVQDLINESIGKIGENIKVGQFVRIAI